MTFSAKASSIGQNVTSDPTLTAALPPQFQTTGTTITAATAGNSGAGVYLIESVAGKAVLKITPNAQDADAWLRSVAIQQAAANLGLAPAILHVDPARHAVLSAFIADRSFPAYYGNPQTRNSAITEVGRMLKRLHSITTTTETPTADPLGLLRTFWERLQPSPSSRLVPTFAVDAAQRIMREEAPLADRTAVLSHNDMNPTNLVHDGERVLILDWQTTALNDPYYDLGTFAMFLRMDETSSLQLLSAYDNAVVTAVPARFIYFRRMAATLSGSAFLYAAIERGYTQGDTETLLENTPTLGDIYSELRSGELQLSSLAGQWRFGLALLKEGIH